MGLTICDGINDFLKEASNVSFKDKKILMLGKQVIYMDAIQLFILANRIGINLNRGDFIKNDKQDHIDSYSFFKALGFSEVCALDISNYEQATIIFDLNSKEIPETLKEKFDYIVDGGTLEHVFDISNALKNIAGMLKEGGKIYHYLPAANMINHGFYSFSPSLLNYFYKENGFVIQDLQIVLGSRAFFNDMISAVFPKKLEDCLSTGIDYRLLNLMDGSFEILKDYKGTLKCIAEKRRILMNKTPVQRHWYQYTQEVFAAIKERFDFSSLKENSIAIWGMGNTALDLLGAINNDISFENKIIMGVFNGNDQSLLGEKWNEYLVLDWMKAETYGLKYIVIAAVDYEEEIYNQIKWIENKGVKIIKLKKYIR